MNSVLVFAATFASSPALAWLVCRAQHTTVRDPRFYFAWTCGALGGAVSSTGNGQQLHLAAWLSSALLALLLWWWRRRKNRMRALKQFGAKSRARIAELARNMPKPSPRLVPEGVPA